MRTSRTSLAVAGAGIAALTLFSAGSASAYGSYGGGSYGGGFDAKPASYINPDTGAATANPDVNANSSCFAPDQYDMQAFSPAGTTTNNVHNDACFLDDRGNKVGKGIGATFTLRGVGAISACPDPDGAGPETARNIDTNGDGRNDTCIQSSYQDRGALGVADVAGDFEYHARINNNMATAGDSDVEWGLDRNLDGKLDGYRNDDVKITWSADGLAGGQNNYRW